MKKYTLRVLKDAEAVAQAAASEFVKSVQVAVAERGSFKVALSSGATLRRMLELLASDSIRTQVDWSKLHVFWTDERPVGPEHPESNYRLVQQALLSKVPIPPEQVHRLRGEMTDLDAAALAYQKEMAAVFGIVSIDAEPPTFDLILLGLGRDGHTASLFPATPALGEIKLWVMRNPVLKLETQRLTFTPGVINRARQVFFLVYGHDKAQILADVLEGPLDQKRLPAQMIQPMAGPPLWLVDQAAAEKLKRK